MNQIQQKLLSKRLTSEKEIIAFLKELQKKDPQSNLTQLMANEFSLPECSVTELLKEIDGDGEDETEKVAESFANMLDSVSNPTDT